MRNPVIYLAIFLVLAGCATAENALGAGKLQRPPEFNQKVMLDVSEDFHMHQAPLSRYDVGDLENFHIQHTLPVVVEDAFKEIFGEVQVVEKGPKIEMKRPDVPAVFEVKMIDAANDNYFESADTYRGEVTLAVAMKSPRDHIFWQKSFRGQGFVHVDPQFATGLGPQDALVEALRDAVDQMQKAILNSPEVRNQMKYYQSIEEARKKQEIHV